MKKNIHYKIQIFTFLILILLSISGCYHYPEFEDFEYEDYNRVIGPEGGEINFYRNYENDSLRELAVKMIFPENAVDSVLVFNMYEFFHEVSYYDLMYVLNIEPFSHFLYFVPFYESEGYREVLNDSSDYEQLVEKHNSIYFNRPVTVTYYNFAYEAMPDTSNLYQIKIPYENEWGEEDNVWVNYNLQGYPNGYDEIDLIYLILGRWSETIYWGDDEFSLENWEAVPGFIYDHHDKTVTFNIYDTDNMYVMGNLIIK